MLGGALATVALEVAVAGAALVLGLIPIGADSSPATWEVSLMGLARRTALVRRVRADAPAVIEGDAEAGAAIYADLCARCHGWPGSRVPVLGRSLYPPAPTLHPEGESPSEVFWIVKHGLRHTGMPAWGELLSDRDIQDVSAAVTRLGAIAPRTSSDGR